MADQTDIPMTLVDASTSLNTFAGASRGVDASMKIGDNFSTAPVGALSSLTVGADLAGAGLIFNTSTSCRVHFQPQAFKSTVPCGLVFAFLTQVIKTCAQFI